MAASSGTLAELVGRGVLDAALRQSLEGVLRTPVFFTSVDLEKTYNLTQRGVESPSPREREHFVWLASLAAPYGAAPRPA